MNMNKLLAVKPDADAFWQQYGEQLMLCGYKKTDITDVETLIEMRIICSAMEGDIAAVKYINEQSAKERRRNIYNKAGELKLNRGKK